MRINFKTAGRLVRFLPPGSRDKTAALEVAEGATAIDVIRQLGMPEDGSYLVILNGASLPKSERPSRQLAENDNLSVMPPLKGG